MYKIYKNGVLYKITNSLKCVDSIVERFLKTWVKNDELVVEKNGEVVQSYFYF